jgi:hypothetical protein
MSARGHKKPGAENLEDISATRLSPGDPVGFPSRPRERFSSIGYLGCLVVTALRLVTTLCAFDL